MRLINLERVPKDAELAINLYNYQGQTLIKAGMKLTPKMIQRIKSLGYQSIYVSDSLSNEILDDYMEPSIRFRAFNMIHEAFDAYQYYVSIKENKENATDHAKSEAEYLYLNKLKDISSELIQYLSNKNQIQIQFMDLKRKDDYLIRHSLNVAIYSILLGFKLGFNREQISILGVGALLSDIGMNNVNERVTLKKDKLDAKDKKEVRKHPVWGYKFLKENHLISPLTRAIVLQHHERLDGSGYPRGLEGDKILELSQVVSVADTFDALTSDRPYRKALQPKFALDYIVSKTGIIANERIIQKFMTIITPYPNGTLVRLSNDILGVIKEQNTGYPLRPKLEVLRLENNELTGYPIDLLKENSLTIQGIDYSSKDEIIIELENV